MNTKNNKHNVILTFICIALVVVTGACSDDDDESASKADEVTAMLTASTWNVDAVTVANVDQSDIYPGLKVTFTTTGFTAVNGEPVWPATSSWTFTSADATVIKRGDGLEMTILQITDTQLKLGLTWDETTIGPGRINSVSGQHVFTFTK